MDCAICLNHIELHDESYLYPCFHRYCFNCIRQWTESQTRHQAVDNGTLACLCPLCKAAYSQIIYDCVGSSYRSLSVTGEAGAGPAYPLTAEQNRRRALYLTQTVDAAGGESSSLAQVYRKGVHPRLPINRTTADWITRDLQAVLLEEDVDIIVQHVLGVLKAIADKQMQRKTRLSLPDHSPVYGQHAAFVDAVRKAVSNFLHEKALAQVFAEQLWSFLHSGLTIAAYDRMLFGGDESIAGGSDSGRQQPEGLQPLVDDHPACS